MHFVPEIPKYIILFLYCCHVCLQFPECEDQISIACLDLYYSVPFNHKKHKSEDDVMPMVLPNLKDDSIDDSDNEYMDEGDLFSAIYDDAVVEDRGTVLPCTTMG